LTSAVVGGELSLVVPQDLSGLIISFKMKNRVEASTNLKYHLRGKDDMTPS
jgi:hypothetical protein